MQFREFHRLEKQLNPSLWLDTGLLRPEVRTKLLKIAKDFRSFCEVDFPVVDIIITGSNVNYNYTARSDLDLHLVTDYEQIDCDQELEELFDSKRRLYELERNVKIRGIPVTLYVEDIHRPGVSQGVFSVLNNRWIKQASRQQPEIDLSQVKREQQMWQIILRHAVKSEDLDTAEAALTLLRKYRKLGLQQPQGEFHTANIVYKQLRNQGLPDRLQDLVNQLRSQRLSIR